MALYSFSQLERLWIDAGGNGALAPLMAAIAIAESGEEHNGTWYANSDALNPNDNGGTQTSVGLWQVSTGRHDYPPDWTSPVGNARAAVDKWRTQGLGAWGTYTSGAYRQFLQGNVPPATGLPPAPSGTAGSGGLGGFIDTIGKALNFSFWSQGVPDVKQSASSVAQAIASVTLPLVKFAEALDWFFHPAHWIRIFAGLAGGVLVVGGVWQMSHAGGA